MSTLHNKRLFGNEISNVETSVAIAKPSSKNVIPNTLLESEISKDLVGGKCVKLQKML